MFIPIKSIYLPVGEVNKIPTNPAIYMDDECIHSFTMKDNPKFAVGNTFHQSELISVTDDGCENWGKVRAHYIIERFDTQAEAIHFAHVIAACSDCGVKVFDMFCFNRETGEYEDRNFEMQRQIKRALEKRKNSDQMKITALEDEKSALIQMKNTADKEADRWRSKAVELARRLGEKESELRRFTQPIGE